MIANFRKYNLLVVFALPLFFLATTLHHSVDIENFLPEEHSENYPVSSFADILEEISTEDDIHSHLIFIDFLNNISIYSESAIDGKNLFVIRIPSPPPDFV